jgi:hypothetical protein
MFLNDHEVKKVIENDFFFFLILNDWFFSNTSPPTPALRSGRA